MKPHRFFKNTRSILLCLGMVILCRTLFAQSRFDVIENFESGAVTLYSWLNEDIQPTAWQLVTTGTYNNSAYSLSLTGNTWKQQFITPILVSSSTVFEIAAKTSSGAN
ncbi:MAG: hypothetical protein Q8J62_05365, partial [Candidatus Cloacimonadaceae bacterium]|nr:hypothetical protein [Candidatus Cloacimonadaceae bacterium]